MRFYHAVLTDQGVVRAAVKLKALTRMVDALLLIHDGRILPLKLLGVEAVEDGEICRDLRKSLELA